MQALQPEQGSHGGAWQQYSLSMESSRESNRRVHANPAKYAKIIAMNKSLLWGFLKFIFRRLR